MKRIAVIVVALVVVIGSGLVHGVWGDRWQKSTALEEACARVAQVPLELGDWHGKEVIVDDEEFRRAGAEAYWMRTYTHRRQPLSVLVILMCGRAGRMSVHTPEVCYQGAGFQMLGTPRATKIAWADDEEPGRFWTARFGKNKGVASDLRLSWAWNPGSGWQAPLHPRWDYRGKPFLYKLYVSRQLAVGEDDAAADSTVEFMRPFLQELQRTLFPFSRNPQGSAAE